MTTDEIAPVSEAPGILGPVSPPSAGAAAPPAPNAGGGNGTGGPQPPSLAPSGHREPEADLWPPGVPTDRSSYLRYLPGIFSRNDFLARYLLIFEAILNPIERTIGNMPYDFDPATTPADLLPWLGSWLGILMDESWEEERRRDLVRDASELYRWRGTPRGLSHYIRVCTGFTPEIIEPTLTEISANRGQAFRFTVRLRVPRGTRIDRGAVQRIIDAEKPAFAVGVLDVQFG